MKNELDSKLLLRVFDKVRQHGNNTGSDYLLEGIKVFSDFDGYTLSIEDALVKLSFGFHNQYHYEYDSKDHLETFEAKLAYIDKHY